MPVAAGWIRTAVDDGSARPGTDPDVEAKLLMGAFFGLSLAVLADTETGEGALAALAS